MDCDRVFVILTRGPFPTGHPSDELVESHLEECGDCWRLAEALRPALEMFQEAVPPAESRDLPGYWGDARPASTVVASLTQPMKRSAPSPGPGRDRCVQRELRGATTGQETPAPLLRAIALAATVTAAALALNLLLRG
jgi:hypothetical protein